MNTMANATKGVAVAAAFLAITYAAPSAAITGNDWVRFEQSPSSLLTKTAYLRASMDAEAVVVHNSMLIPLERRKGALLPFCQPNGADADQGVRLVDDYLRMHPEDTHKEMIVLLRSALISAWPCPNF